jgi:hypothetical protein
MNTGFGATHRRAASGHLLLTFCTADHLATRCPFATYRLTLKRHEWRMKSRSRNVGTARHRSSLPKIWPRFNLIFSVP